MELNLNEKNKRILVTGAAGFIGAELVKKLLDNELNVLGIDNINSYYDTKLKFSRLKRLDKNCIDKKKWKFIQGNIDDENFLNNIFFNFKPHIVVNLAAQAGVRYSLENPNAYIKSNLVGFGNILENCRKSKVEHLVYASSSSVYGGNYNLPFDENQSVNHPVSFYAATKKSNELMAHSYSHLYGIPCTGLRFFTVYGPWGRPDMAPMIFAKSMLERKPIKVFNYGKMKRDFTYIDDIVEGLFRCCFKSAKADSNFNRFIPKASRSFAPHMIFNIGNSQPIELLNFIEKMEQAFGINAIKEFEPIQDGDVIATAADTQLLKNWVGFQPSTPLVKGLKSFASWYLKYYR